MMELIFSHCSLVYSFIFCNFVFQPFLFLTLFPILSFFSFLFNPVASLSTFALCFPSGCFFFFVLLGTLPSSSLSRPFLYPHSLFFPTALKKPNGETSAFSKNFLTKKGVLRVSLGCPDLKYVLVGFGFETLKLLQTRLSQNAWGGGGREFQIDYVGVHDSAMTGIRKVPTKGWNTSTKRKFV